MPMPWWSWLLPLLVVALVIYRLARATPSCVRHVGLDAVEEHLRHLLNSDGRTPVLILEREGTAGVLQVTAAGRGTNRTLELELPQVDWSAAHFDDVETALRTSGFAPRQDGGSKCGEVRRFLSVSVSGTATDLPGQGARLIALVGRALDWPADVLFTVHVERAARPSDVENATIPE